MMRFYRVPKMNASNNLAERDTLQQQGTGHFHEFIVQNKNAK